MKEFVACTWAKSSDRAQEPPDAVSHWIVNARRIVLVVLLFLAPPPPPRSNRRGGVVLARSRRCRSSGVGRGPLGRALVARGLQPERAVRKRERGAQQVQPLRGGVARKPVAAAAPAARRHPSPAAAEVSAAEPASALAQRCAVAAAPVVAP